MFDWRISMPALRVSAVAASLIFVAGCRPEIVEAAAGADAPETPVVTTPDEPAVTDPVAPTTPTIPTAPTTPTTPPTTSPPVAPEYTPVTALPELTKLSNVRVTLNGQAATITFDAVDDAADYRVFALPSDSGIKLGSDGSVIIPNAIYRCAGAYQTPEVQVEDRVLQSHGTAAKVASNVNGYNRSLDEAVLGYVYTSASAAPGLVPVYVSGNPSVSADNEYYVRYEASRDKIYSTSSSEHQARVARGWLDGGVAFYVHSQSSAETRAVLTNSSGDSFRARYYLNEGAELNFRKGGTAFSTAFHVLTSQAAGTMPLMRVHYVPLGGGHDELVVGKANFTRVRYQGLKNPATTLHFSGIAGETTLVVEALDKGCPHQGVVASEVAQPNTDGGVAYPVWHTIASLQASVADGEVFINGQHDGIVGKPKAIARTYLNVAPKARSPMDWMSTAESYTEKFTQVHCGAPDGNCFKQVRLQSDTYDVNFLAVAENRWKIGSVLGEMLVTYADWAADTNGKVRITPRKKATITSGSFVHATMEVNSVGSGRRYPQLILSDQDAPVQYNLVNGRTLIMQTFHHYPQKVQLQICDHRDWDVNNQCPHFIFRNRYNSDGSVWGVNPIPESDSYLSAVDASVRFDLYASDSRAYLLVNGKPYGCANLKSFSGVTPAPVSPVGEVSVTFGDVLYHSGVDESFKGWGAGGYISRHSMIHTTRHFDNLGFSSGVAAPQWDESRLPCTSVTTAGDSDPWA